MDKAGKKYWDDSWAHAETQGPVDPRDRRLKNTINWRFHRLFSELFTGFSAEGKRLLEVGCAKSVWLPYFSKEFGFHVSGIDYSPAGCEMSRKILSAGGVDAEIVCADFFSAPASMVGAFDAVVSFGVVEHFDNTASCLKAISAFLRPGGLLFTSIPNINGGIGALQKIINRPVYDIHRRLSPEALIKEHEAAGLKVIKCGYFLFTDFGVNNLQGVKTGTISWLLKKIVLSLLARLSRLAWLFEDATCELPPNKFSSPFIICVARKP